MKLLAGAVLGALALGAERAQALDLWIDNVYVTQATQTYNKSVPLVAARRGLVRIFTRANQANSAVVPVKLDFYYNGVFSKSVRVNPRSGFTGVPTSVNSQNYTYSHDYTLSAADIRPGLQLVVEVDPDTLYPQSNYLNDVWPQGARRTDYSIDTGKLVRENVWNAPVFQTMLVPLRTYNGLVGDVNANNLESYVNYLRRVLPVPEALDVKLHSPYYFNGTPGPNYDNQWTRVLNELDALRYAERQSTRHYYGVLKPYYSSGGTGMAWIGGWAGMGIDWNSSLNGGNGTTTWRSGTYAHETGHNLGLQHAPCGGAAGTDPNYPYSWASIGVTGYDVWQNQIFNPNDGNSWTDLMGYCGYDWVSDYQYKRALSWRDRNDWPAAGTRAGAAAATGAQSLLIWGRIENGQVILEPAFRVDDAPTPEAKNSDYAIESSDAYGRVVARHSFTVYPSDHGEDQGFAFRMALPRAANGSAMLAANALAASELRLVQNGATRASLRRAPAMVRARAARPAAVTRGKAGHRVLEWDGARYPVALVRNAANGEVMGFARDGRFEFEAGTVSAIAVQFSEGLDSTSQTFAL